MKFFIFFLVTWSLSSSSNEHSNHKEHDESQHEIDSTQKGFENSTISGKDVIEKDGDDILILTTENFNATLAKYDLLLVEFCKPDFYYLTLLFQN